MIIIHHKIDYDYMLYVKLFLFVSCYDIRNHTVYSYTLTDHLNKLNTNTSQFSYFR